MKDDVKGQKMNIKPKNKYKILFYIIGILIIVFFHMFYDLSDGDIQVTYGNILVKGSTYWPEDSNVFEAIYNFTYYHYTSWSSRSVIEAIMIIIGVLPTYVWHILDILLVILLAYSIDTIIDIDNKQLKYCVLLVLLLLYPITIMQSSGWIATTMNYSWIVSLGTYLYSVVLRIRRNDSSIKWFSYILAFLAGIYAFNHEQFSIFSIVMLTTILLLDIKKKYSGKFVIFLLWVINLVELIAIIMCPGNSNRLSTEITAYIPDYSQYTFFDKLYVGLRSLVTELFGIGGVFLTIAIILLLLLLSFILKKHITIKIILIASGLYTVGRQLFHINFVKSIITWPEPFNVLIDKYDANVISTWIAIIISIIIFIICIYFIWDSKNLLLMCVALITGAGTKVMLGFTTGWLNSGERTSIYLWFVLLFYFLYCTSFYEKDITKRIPKKESILNITTAIITVGLCAIQLFLFSYYF